MRRAALLLLLVALALPALAHASFPGKNGKIAFVRGGDIYTVEPDSSGVVQLTSGPARDLSPSWSPDGKRIAFESDRDDPNAGTCLEHSCNWEIYVVNADGSGLTRLTTNSAMDRRPGWSPDGGKLVFDRNVMPGGFLVEEIWVMNADGSGQTQITHESGDPTFTYSFDPAWSPDGAQISFTRFDGGFDQVLVMNPDGSGQTQLTRDVGNESQQNWSPDSTRMVYTTDAYNSQEETFCAPEVFVMKRDGSEKSSLTPRSPGNPCPLGPGGFSPAWSPDGGKIAFLRTSNAIYVMNANGSNPVPLTSGDQPDWQPIPVTGYARPRGATPAYFSLVIAYDACTSANRQHGPPLSVNSCNPSQQSSSYLTVGTLDANGQAARANGSVYVKVNVGNPSTPADEADVRLSVSIKDVRMTSTLSDYPGELSVQSMRRITDKDNTPNPGGPGPATTNDLPLAFTVPCAPTADTGIGSLCSVTTTADTLVPGQVKEEKRSIWQLGQVQVYDGGADLDADTTADNTLFMDEGLFVP